jgi:hypothetical protein
VSLWAAAAVLGVLVSVEPGGGRGLACGLPHDSRAHAVRHAPSLRTNRFFQETKTMNTIHNKLQAFLQLLEFRIIGSAVRHAPSLRTNRPKPKWSDPMDPMDLAILPDPWPWMWPFSCGRARAQPPYQSAKTKMVRCKPWL